MRALTLLLAGTLVACGPADPPADPTPPPPEETPEPDEEAPPAEDEIPDPAGGWQPASEAPVALTEVAAAAFGGDIWVAGGLAAGGSAVSTVQVYEPDFDTWGPGPDLPEPVHHAALVATGSELLLIGGYVGSGFGQPSAAVQRLDPATGAWEPGPALPEPRAAGAAAWDGSRVVYGGGVGPGGLAGDVLVLVDGSWEQLGSLSEPREHLAAAGDGEGRAWFLAGRTAGLDTNVTAVDLVEGDQVRRIGDVPTARGGLAGFWHPSAGACAVGGEAPDGTFAEVECLDAEGAVTVLPPLQHPRHGLGAGAVEGFAYTLLGGPEPALTVSATVEVLALE